MGGVKNVLFVNDFAPNNTIDDNIKQSQNMYF